MKFDFYLPCEKLKPYVERLVISESEEEKVYKVLPGTNLVIGFQYNGSLVHVQEQQQVALQSSGLTGLHDSFRVFKNSTATGSVLVYFRETGAASFFRVPIHELFRESVSLENFMLRSELLVVENQLLEAKTDLARIKVVEDFLLSRLKPVPPDGLVMEALALIHKSKGGIRIKELLEKLNISQSPLEKRFRRVVGTSPKKFASIVRFKHLIEGHKPQNSLTELSYEAGFYDQAHFIKEFKTFTGETPEKFFANPASEN